MKLLTSNAKLSKDSGFSVAGLAFAPANKSGYEVCPDRGACTNCCVLYYSGRTVMPNVRKAMINRTRWFFEDRKSFLAQLHKELKNFAKRDNPAIRLNVASDLPWESIDPTLFDYDIQFYDYTKTFSRWKACVEGDMPDNYNIVYSWNERSDKRAVNNLLSKGGNINVVYNAEYHPQSGKYGDLPKKLKIGSKTWQTVDGDLMDVRIPELDGKNKAVMVRFKGMKQKEREKYIKSGFVIDGTKI